MILGFTGTRHGMTERQRAAVSGYLDKYRPVAVHSGDCKGADSEFLDAALLCNGNSPPRTHGHPCNIAKWRAGRKYDHLYPVKSPMERNRDIVNACDELLAAPRTMERTPHSGTWQTIAMAREIKKTVIVAWPDGTVTGSGYTSLEEIFGMPELGETIDVGEDR
jgi:hypothetical protein